MVFYTDMMSPILPYIDLYFEKCSSDDYWRRCNMWVEDLVRILYVNIVSRVFARVHKQSQTAQGQHENDLQAHKHSHAAATNKTAMLHLHKSLGGREDLSKQNIQFIHAIRIKFFNIRAGKFPDDFKYQAPLSADIGFVSCPSGHTGIHSSFRNTASLMENAASLSSHRRYEKDKTHQSPSGLTRNIKEYAEEERVRECLLLHNGPFLSLFSHIC